MTAGLPGAGIGGMFYMLSAVSMPFTALWRTARRIRGRRTDVPKPDWPAVLRQFSIAAGIIVALWMTGWGLGHLIVAHPAALGGMNPARHREVPNVLKIGALLLSVGTLCAVLVAVQVARAFVQPRSSAKRRAALLIMIGILGTSAARAQSLPAGDVSSHLAAAESAYNAGQNEIALREYSAVLAADPQNSRALFRLGQLTRSDPSRSLGYFRRYVAIVPRDAWGHMALGDELARDGQITAALAEYDAAERLAPGNSEVAEGRARIIARARGNAPAIELASTGLGDSDGNRGYRGGVTLSVPVADRARVSVVGGAKRVTGFTTATEYDGSLGFTARPESNFRFEASAGAVRATADTAGLTVTPSADFRFQFIPGRGRGRGSGGSGTTPPTGTVIHTETGASQTVAVGSVRGVWKQHGAGAMLDLRANRILLDATPVLVVNRVIRNELAGRVDLPIIPRVRLRAAAKGDSYDASGESNTRTSLLGGLAVSATDAVEVSGIFQRLTFDHATTSGYFAPRIAQLAELGSYAEFETDNGSLLVLDGGVGAQRFADFGTAIGPWKPAFRLFAQFTVPLNPGSELRAELDSYDSVLGSEAASSESWRYLSGSISLRFALR
jgi:hypothetical protein